jgi:hypothetical protein
METVDMGQYDAPSLTKTNNVTRKQITKSWWARQDLFLLNLWKEITFSVALARDSERPARSGLRGAAAFAELD